MTTAIGVNEQASRLSQGPFKLGQHAFWLSGALPANSGRLAIKYYKLIVLSAGQASPSAKVNNNLL